MRVVPTPAETWALWTTVLGLLHHADHVLRVNHSEWPFLAEVTPFTYSLAVYPLIAMLLWARGWHRLRAGLAGLLFVFPTVSHVTLETPLTQYRTWAYRPEVNMLGVSSPTMGAVAVTITLLLSAAAFMTALGFWREARGGRMSA